MLFERTYPKPLEVPTSTRESNYYMMKIIRTAGLDLYDDFGFRQKCWRVFSFAFGMLYYPLSFVMNYIIHIKEFDPDELLLSLQLCLNAWSLALKFFTLALHTKHLENANKCFDELDKFCVTKEEQLSMRRTVAYCNKVYVVFAAIYWLYATSSLVDGLINGRVPFNTWYPFINWRRNKTQMYVQAFVEYFTIGYCITVATSTDSYGVIFVEALRQHVRLLKARVQNLGTNKDTDNDKNYAELVDCIKAHKIMLDLCDLIRPLISGTIFTQFIVCGSVLGITTINLVAFAEPSALFGIIFYIMGVLMQTFPLCYYCNCLVDDCIDLADATFHSSWPDQSQRYQKTVLQYLQKVQQPMTFTAMNIFNVNLATNINVGKFAFTVYAIAQGMNLDEKLGKKE